MEDLILLHSSRPPQKNTAGVIIIISQRAFLTLLEGKALSRDLIYKLSFNRYSSQCSQPSVYF